MTGVVTEQFGQMSVQMNRMSENNRKELEALTRDSREVMEQLTADAGKRIRDEVEQISRHSEDVKQTVNEINGQVTGLKEELSEKIHTEDVKVYRNIKDLFEEQKPLFGNVEVSPKSMKPVKKYIYWLILFGILDLAGVIALILMEAGVF